MLIPKSKNSELKLTRQLSLAEQIHNQTLAQTCLIILLFLLGLYTIKSFIPSLIWAVIFAIACWPLYQKTKKKWLSTSNTFILPFIFSCFISLLFILPLTVLLIEGSKDIQAIILWIIHVSHQGVEPPLWISKLPFAKNFIYKWWVDNLSHPKMVSLLLSNLHYSHGVYVTQKIGSQLVHRGLLFFFSMLTLFFIFRDGEHIAQQCLRGSRRLFGKQGETIAQQMILSIHGTVSGLILVGLGQGVVLGIIYYFMSIPHSALFGIITAVSAMIPFCPIFAILFVSGTAFLQLSPWSALCVLIIGCIVVFISDHFIRPTLIGGATKLPFIWVLIGIVGGLETWGMIGLFVGPALMAALIMLWNNWTLRDKSEP
ncbi:Putative transport protein YdiK [Commensalibacter sp. Nvir]|uniref:AI-2E family transporter n=1 Tax=Commensalibacter sp. Nvir TaxID=3069817 RepID=UPI002D2C3AB5|nr:Putative transport protein YdiK [Commensalibacter sp. Nvir]